MGDPRIVTEIDDHVAHVRFNRPERINALDREQFEAIIAAGESLAQNSAIKCVILSGEGKGFCAGLDVKAISQGGADALQNGFIPRGDGGNMFQRAVTIWRDLPVPVIAAIHGPCLGGGLQLALAADIRIARPDAAFSIREVKLGIIPDMAGTYYLPKLMRDDVLNELIYTARDFSGEEALRYGMITSLAEDPLTAAKTLAAQIASQSRSALMAAKSLIASGHTNSRVDQLGAEAKAQIKLLKSEEFMASMMATLRSKKA